MPLHYFVNTELGKQSKPFQFFVDINSIPTLDFINSDEYPEDIIALEADYSTWLVDCKKESINDIIVTCVIDPSSDFQEGVITTSNGGQREKRWSILG